MNDLPADGERIALEVAVGQIRRHFRHVRLVDRLKIDDGEGARGAIVEGLFLLRFLFLDDAALILVRKRAAETAAKIMRKHPLDPRQQLRVLFEKAALGRVDAEGEAHEIPLDLYVDVLLAHARRRRAVVAGKVFDDLAADELRVGDQLVDAHGRTQ